LALGRATTSQKENTDMTATTPPTFTPGDRIRSRVHRYGVLNISPGDTGTVRSTGLRDYTEPYVSVTMHVRGGVVHTSFAPDDIEKTGAA
jgi:hypothetical protein